jgi:hypothetical protein
MVASGRSTLQGIRLSAFVTSALAAVTAAPIYGSELEKRAAESSAYRTLGGEDGEGAHSKGCIADTSV